LKVVAVIVTFHSDLAKLFELLSTLGQQVDSIIVVDNGSSIDVLESIRSACPTTVEGIALKSNLGIASAQNIGIARAREMGADYVLLLDQDSAPHHSKVRKLLAAAEKIRATGQQPACVGPRYLDDRQQNPPSFIRVTGLTLERCTCPAEDSVAPIDYLIASGCLIPMSVLDQVGGMREDLFIDYVDIEWGLWARRHGFQSYGVCAAKMVHSLEDELIEFFGKKLPLHSPLRHYYHFRNAVILYKEQWVPGNWKLVDGWRLLLKYVFYSIFAKPRMAHWRMMTIGVWHGLRGRAGKFGGRTY
jgi:rhamnosyltransferase